MLLMKRNDFLCHYCNGILLGGFPYRIDSGFQYHEVCPNKEPEKKEGVPWKPTSESEK